MAGYIVERSFSETNSSAGTVTSATSVSIGDSHSITASDMITMTTLPVSMGRNASSICTSWRSELARDTS